MTDAELIALRAKQTAELGARLAVVERRYDAACRAIHAYYHALDTTRPDVAQAIADALADYSHQHA
jgi:hypothetical protein